MEPRGTLRRGLAGRRSGDLLPVEPLPGHLGFHPLRRPAHSLPAHAHRPDPRPDLQDPALCGHRDRAGLYLHAQQPRQAAAGQFGPGIFPGGAVGLCFTG